MPSKKKKGRATGSGGESASQGSAILQAVLGNHADALEQLIRGIRAMTLSSKIRVPPQGLTAHIVTMDGRKLEQFVSPEVGAVTPLDLAVDNGCRECLEVLLRAGVSPNGSIPETQAGGRSPLSLCLGGRMQAYLDCFLLLLEAGTTMHAHSPFSTASSARKRCRSCAVPPTRAPTATRR